MLLNNPKTYAAKASRDAGLNEKNIARAALLPKVSINYIRNRTERSERVEQSNPLNRDHTVQDRFFGKRAGLNIEQVLFDYSAISTYRMGKVRAEYAEIEYRLQLQQQAISLIDAYLNVILARDLLKMTRHQQLTYQDILHDNKTVLARGEGTRIDILETRAQLGTIRAQLVDYDNQLADALKELSTLLGERVQASQLMSIDLYAEQLFLQGVDIKTLQSDAFEQNPDVQAARLTIHHNELSIQQARAGFMPRVLLFATHDRIDSDSTINSGRNYNSNTIGLQVSVPIFSGGSSHYATRRAHNQLERARYDLDDKSNNIEFLLEKHYRTCITSMERIHLLRQSATDGFDLVAALRKSVIGGERTNSDVLDAENQTYQARRDLLRAVVQLFQAYPKVQFYAGRFSEDDVLVLNNKMLF
ncbi:TolC family outer membrane protein [Pseudomonas sp. Z2-11]